VYKARAAAENTAAQASYLKSRLPALLVVAHQSPARRTSVEDKMTLLAAIELHGCWESCRETRDGSYALAQFLIDVVVFYTVLMQTTTLIKPDTRSGLIDVADQAEPRILRLLNAWIKPAAPWLGIPSSERVGESLFGIAWWTFNVRTPYESNGLLKKTVPPFAPGHVPWSDAHAACALPEMLALED
jgi:hypothetical protein